MVRDDAVIDGHVDGMPRVVTHIHSDHIVGISRTISLGQAIIGTPLTVEWLNALGFRVPLSTTYRLSYGQRLKLGGGVIELVKAEHIPGTAQVIYEDAEGLRTVYTSDFKKPGVSTPIIEADVLVIDAVYGDPRYVRDFDDYIDDVLADLVRQLLSQGPVYIYGYYGKVQEVMQLLRSKGISAPFLLPHKQFLLTKVAERLGMYFGDYFHASSSEGREVMRGGWYVYLRHYGGRVNGPGNHLVLSGWEFSRPFRMLGNRRWLVAFSDHADFNGLISYVKESKARLVVVNRFRSSGAGAFANYVRRKLGIDAVLLP